MGPSEVEQSEEKAATYAFNTLKHWFHFKIRDINFSNKEYYKYSFQRVRAKYIGIGVELQ